VMVVTLVKGKSIDIKINLGENKLDKYIVVQIDLEGKGRLCDLWEGIFFGVTKEKVKDLWECFDDVYEHGEYNGYWEDYLEEHEVQFEHWKFDMSLGRD
jgi:hypothetical protein